MTPPVVLTIAGSDSGAGAGIQADLKTFAALGCYGTSVFTAVTAQNTVEVRDVFAMPPTVVGLQMAAVLEDFAGGRGEGRHGGQRRDRGDYHRPGPGG